MSATHVTGRGVHYGKKAVALAGLFVTTLLSVGLVAIQSSRREPLYEGQRFSEWMNDLIVGFDVSPSAENLARGEKAFFALHEMGDSAVPSLLPIIHKKDFKAWVWCVAVVNRVPGVHVRHVSAEERARFAMAVFNEEGPKAKAALIMMLAEPDVNGRKLPQWAAESLVSLGDDAVQPLVEAIHDRKNPELRAVVATTLARFTISEKAKFVEFTTNDVNSHIVFDWYGGSLLGRISPENGKHIFKALETALEDEDLVVRSSATNALRIFARSNPLKAISG